MTPQCAPPERLKPNPSSRSTLLLPLLSQERALQGCVTLGERPHLSEAQFLRPRRAHSSKALYRKSAWKTRLPAAADLGEQD